MCGIVGVLELSAMRPVEETCIDGLRRLEYRGYDSAGLALQNFSEGGGTPFLLRAVGPLSQLEQRLSQREPATKTHHRSARVGIGHTRWATHGKVAERNAHPLQAGRISLVVNGIIENCVELREQLKNSGVTLLSETDSELVAHLLSRARERHPTMIAAAVEVMRELRGSFAGVWMEDGVDELYAMKSGTPLVAGRGNGTGTEKNRWMVGSDTQALGGFVSEAAYLPEGCLLRLSRHGAELFDQQGNEKPLTFSPFAWQAGTASREPYAHFMLKEIREQPECLVRTFASTVDFGASSVNSVFHHLDAKQLARFDRVLCIACGTAYHAALVGKGVMEREAGLPVECDLSSEFRYRDAPIDERTLCIAVTQSGETADTLAAIKHAKRAGAYTLVITNVAGSSATREADDVFVTRCDPEYSVAATKTFTGQVLALQLVALTLAKARDRLTREQEMRWVKILAHAPVVMTETIEAIDHATQDVSSWSDYKTFLFIGRGPLFPLALEGALKLKEVSYLHAEGYAAGELKHGPIAMVDEKTLCFVFQGDGVLGEKTASNMEEVRTRGATIVRVGPGGEVPIVAADRALIPYTYAIAAQFIAYRVALQLGHDPDRPRNLAKSVTVE